MSPNNDWNILRNDPDPIAQNEKIPRLFLQLAMHTVNRLTHLRKEIGKGCDCNRRNDNPLISMTEILVTQSPSQSNLEWLDKNKKIMNHSSEGDFEINADQNQTTSYPQSQELFDSNLPNIDNQTIVRNLNSKMSTLIPKSVQNAQNTSSNSIGDNHEILNSDTLQKPSLDSDTASNSFNANEFRPDSQTSNSNDVNDKLLNQIDLAKNITNTSVMNDLIKTVNEFFPKSQDLPESTSSINQRLFGTDLAQIVPKIISNKHENANQLIQSQNTLHTREPSDKSDDISQRFLDPTMIKNFGNTLNPQAADNLPVVKQILPTTKSIVESMIKVLPEAAKNPSNLLNQIISQPQATVKKSLKVAEDDRKSLAHSDYIQQVQSKTTKQAGNEFNLPHNRQDLTSNTESNIRETANTSERNNQETTIKSLPINDDNSTTESNDKQHVSSLLKDSSIPLLRFFSDFNEHENYSKTETDLSSIQTNENTSFTNEKQSTRAHKKTNQFDEEIKTEGFKKTNETRTDNDNEQLSSISEDLSQKNKESRLTDVTVATSMSPIQLESNTFTLLTTTEHQAKSSSVTKDSENVNDVVKSNLEDIKRQDNPSTNDGINQSIEDKITYIDNLLKSNNSLIDDLKSENLPEQLSEEKLQEISDCVISALWSIIEKKLNDNRTYVTNLNKQ